MNQDQALIALCEALLQDGYVTEQPDWQKLILIGEVTDDMAAMSGYSYDLQGSCVLIAPDMSLEPLRRLHEVMKAESATGRGWLKCMIRISREGKVGADFEYKDAKRWEHTPENYKDRMQEYAAMPV